MKKGYILAFSLKLLILFIAIYSLKFQQIKTTQTILSNLDIVYKQIHLENFLFKEILFKYSIFDTDDFKDNYDEVEFLVKFDDKNVEVLIKNPYNYKINLTYSDDCLCFTKVVYQ